MPRAHPDRIGHSIACIHCFAEKRGRAMPITMQCPNCGKGGKLPDTFPGGNVKCPSCGSVNHVPAGGTSRPAAAKPARPKPAAQPAAFDDMDDAEAAAPAPMARSYRSAPAAEAGKS